MKDVMLDLETFGNGNNAVIVQIGACYFDRTTGEIGSTFSSNVNSNDGIRNGFEVTGSTIEWWLQQSEEARKSIIGNTHPVKDAINDLNEFLSKAETIWSHATFDFVIIMNHLNKLGIKPKFHYRSARDIRTLVDIASVKESKVVREGTHHNALSDCLFQVKYCVECFNKLKGVV